MIYPFSCQPTNPGKVPGKQRSTMVVLVLLVGLAGCKKQESTPQNKSQTETSASPEIGVEKPQDNSSTSQPAPSQPASEVLQADQLAPDPSAAALNDRSSAPDKPATGDPAQSAKSASSGLARKRSPQEALAAAKKSQQSATNYARQGKLEPAYKAAVEGWQMVRIHPSDPKCKQLAVTLIEDIKNYSDQLAKAAGGKAGMSDDSKPIRFE